LLCLKLKYKAGNQLIVTSKDKIDFIGLVPGLFEYKKLYFVFQLMGKNNTKNFDRKRSQDLFKYKFIFFFSDPGANPITKGIITYNCKYFTLIVIFTHND
jgi:hypothetical protein